MNVFEQRKNPSTGPIPTDMGPVPDETAISHTSPSCKGRTDVIVLSDKRHIHKVYRPLPVKFYSKTEITL